METTTLPPIPAPEIPSLPPVPAATSDRTLAVLCHISFFLGAGFLLPLIVYLVKRNDCAFTAAHAAEALNFHLSLLIYGICTIPFVFVLIGIPVLIVIVGLGVICAIVAALRASEGGLYHYPLTIRIFR